MKTAVNKERLIEEIKMLAYALPAYHIIEKHICISHNGLKERAKTEFKSDWNNLQVISRFNDSLSHDDIRKIISDALLENIEEIIDWLQNDHSISGREFIGTNCCIGNGIIRDSDWSVLHNLSNICVILTDSTNSDLRYFDVKTAFPCPNIDETDECWDAMEEWINTISSDQNK